MTERETAIFRNAEIKAQAKHLYAIGQMLDAVTEFTNKCSRAALSLPSKWHYEKLMNLVLQANEVTHVIASKYCYSRFDYANIISDQALDILRVRPFFDYEYEETVAKVGKDMADLLVAEGEKERKKAKGEDNNNN